MTNDTPKATVSFHDDQSNEIDVDDILLGEEETFDNTDYLTLQAYWLELRPIRTEQEMARVLGYIEGLAARGKTEILTTVEKDYLEVLGILEQHYGKNFPDFHLKFRLIESTD